MDRRHALHVAAIIVVAVLARVLLFDIVGVWGDYGFYLYNSKLIIEGQQPFVDFLARSPLFMYPLAWLRAAVGHGVALLRAYVIAWWLLSAVPVYLLARELGDHATGIVATIGFLLLPFPLAYGMYANTQGPAVFFALWAVYAVVVSDGMRAYGLAGTLIALGFLSRRSVVTVLAALALFALFERYWSESDWRHLTGRVAALTVAFATTLFVGYLFIMGFDVSQALALYETHAVNLFVTTGRGGFPLLGVSAPTVTNEISTGRIPIFNDVCQLCGRWTARTMTKTLIVSMPAAGVMLYYGRVAIDETQDYVRWVYPIGILAVLAWYAVVTAILAGEYIRVGVILALALFATVAWFVDELPRQRVLGRGGVIIAVVLAGLTAGYLYRNRLLHVYYFMDLYAFVSVLGGVLAVGLWRHADRPLRTMLVAALVLSVIGAGVAHTPATSPLIHGEDELWYQMPELRQYQEDLNARTEPGETILSAQPMFAAVSHTRMPGDNARMHYLYATFHPGGPAAPMYATLNQSLRNGSIRYVIVDDMTQNMLDANDSVANAFTENYCRVKQDDIYQDSNALLYRYKPNCSDEPSLTRLDNATG